MPLDANLSRILTVILPSCDEAHLDPMRLAFNASVVESPKPPLFPPRGIAPSLLLGQVGNTVPFVFKEEWKARISCPEYVRFLNEVRESLSRDPSLELTHVDYFRLCLSAHAATVGSYVPTDVDGQIRFKLWHPALDTSTLAKMADEVTRSLSWDFTAVSARWVQSPETGELLGGYHGEWFSTAVGAYGALRRRDPERAAEIARAILEELEREARIFREFKKRREGIGLLQAATIIAHNLGDLDRVLELWGLHYPKVQSTLNHSDDPLKVAAFRLGHEGGERFGGLFLEAGRMNKAFMASENHRHFALREPRCLRRNPEFLLPIAPFLDEWGERIGRHPDLAPEEVAEIVQSLVAGWERLQATDTVTVGYPRALAGILETFPGGLSQLCEYLPARVCRNLKSGLLRNLCSVPRRRFEEQKAQAALAFGRIGNSL